MHAHTVHRPQNTHALHDFLIAFLGIFCCCCYNKVILGRLRLHLTFHYSEEQIVYLHKIINEPLMYFFKHMHPYIQIKSVV